MGSIVETASGNSFQDRKILLQWKIFVWRMLNQALATSLTLANTGLRFDSNASLVVILVKHQNISSEIVQLWTVCRRLTLWACNCLITVQFSLQASVRNLLSYLLFCAGTNSLNQTPLALKLLPCGVFGAIVKT